MVEEFDALQNSLGSLQHKIKRAAKQLTQSKASFRNVKAARKKKFMECFEVLEKLVDTVYKVSITIFYL